MKAAAYAYLVAKADQHGHVSGIMQKDIGRAVNATQGPVSVAIKGLEQDGLIRVGFDRARVATYYVALPVSHK